MVTSRGEAERLATAPLEVVGQYASASNTTLLCHLGPLPAGRERVTDPRAYPPEDLAIYKPQSGEAPLWDFPTGTLYRREVAASLVDRLLAWDLVPVTVVREDGPLGRGAVQRFVPHDPERHYFWILERGGQELRTQLRQMVLFDIVIDNADRKGGHVLLEDGRIRLVDHGVSFHREEKLRTVAWHFEGEAVPEHWREDVAELAARLRETGAVAGQLRELLSAVEFERLIERADAAAELEWFPGPTGPRPYPWPLL
ncbi:MAG: SCO1664 family protein [Nitriliruptorales bacterium]|nr:SCO1664 family protein [Nitriliruptorales bacterium]